MRRADKRLVTTALQAVLLVAMLPAWASAQSRQPMNLDVLEHGASPFPLIWKPYIPTNLPPADLRNGERLGQQLANGRLALSMKDYLQLVVENDLDLFAARYDFGIGLVDVLRAQSGQAARGTSSSPLPAAVFSGAIGAGVNSVAALSPGGTGGAAISTQGKLVAIGPRGVFDPTVSLNVSYDHLVNPLNTKKIAGAAEVIVPSTVLQTRFQQELPYGTSYSVSFNLQHQTSTQGGLLFNPALSSFFALQVYQPLLNGFGLALTRRFVTLAENDRLIVREAFRGTLNDVLSKAANAYWDLIALRQGVQVAEQAVAASQQLYDENAQRVELGTMSTLDLLSAESQLTSSRVDLLSAQTKLQQQEVLVKTLISKTSDPALDAATIELVDTLPSGIDADLPPLRSAIAAALAKRSSIRQAELLLQNQHIADLYTRKNLLPVLSVFAAANLFGLAPGTSPAVRQLVHWAYPEYSMGFTWSLPVFNRAAQADDLRARLETREAEAALQRTKSQIAMQVQTSRVSLTQDQARVAAAGRATLASRTAFEGEQERLREGVSTPYRVLLAQRDFTSAQSAEIQARVDYAKALVAYQVAVGGFLDQNGVVADEAQRGSLWKDTAKR